MKKLSHTQLGFADQIVVRRKVKKVKDVFFAQINQLIDWKPIPGLIDRAIPKLHFPLIRGKDYCRNNTRRIIP
ncbi:MAG: hypothetical protein ACTTKI_10865 [Tannerella sp.]|uniref:hypothetical protein n=1 Tax=Tannerella sp. TaxID=2382127 RepID=UPI003FA2C3A1